MSQSLPLKIIDLFGACFIYIVLHCILYSFKSFIFNFSKIVFKIQLNHSYMLTMVDDTISLTLEFLFILKDKNK